MKELTKDGMNAISDIIIEAAISSAIEDKRDLLRPSIEHFLSGGRVNGEFDMAIKKLCSWVEKKTIEALSKYASQEVEKEREKYEAKISVLMQQVNDLTMEDDKTKAAMDEARREAAVGMIGWLSNELLETRICVVDGIFYDPENLERIPHSQLYSLYLKSINK